MIYCRDDYMHRKINDGFIRTFKGECVGIVLYQRGEGDPHVCWAVIVEDDENWHLSQNGISSCWLPELPVVTAEAQAWIEQHANKGKYGWEMP